jgi:hypothetical protein
MRRLLSEDVQHGKPGVQHAFAGIMTFAGIEAIRNAAEACQVQVGAAE